MSSVGECIVSLEEVIDSAMMLEKQSMEYYVAARDNALDSASKEFFGWLASEEDRHYATFLEMRDRYVGKTPVGCDLPSGYCSFVRLVVKEAMRCFNFKDGMTLDEATTQALAFEQCLQNYFEKMKNLFSAEDAEVIEKICCEERRHMEAIREYRKRQTLRGSCL